MSVHETTFRYADRGATSVYKFTFPDDDTWYVWFEYEDGSGALYSTPEGGPYHADDELGDAPFDDLDSLLAARGTTRERWIKDLMAQFGERIEWTYP